MLRSERIRKWAGIIIVLSFVAMIALGYFSDLPFETMWGVTSIILLFELALFLVAFSIARLIEKLTGQKPVQKPSIKNIKNQRSGNAMMNNHENRMCPKCGNEVEAGMVFCNTCGTRIQ